MTGSILIAGRDWVGPAVGVLVVALGILAWTYLRAPAQRGLRTLCAALKLVGLLALLACLVEPLWNSQRARPGSNYFAMVADNSQGLQIRDRGETQSRGAGLTNLLGQGMGSWQATLEQNYQLRRYLFDTRLQSSKDFAELNFDGSGTALGSALRSLADRFRGQPLAGVLLFTDGNATDLPEGKLDVSGLPPIYPVVLGREDAINDVAIGKVTVSQTAFEDAPVTVQAEVSAAGYEGRKITAQLLDAAGKPAQELTQRAGRTPDTFRFQVRPEHAGVCFYQLRVSALDEMGQFTNAAASPEATLANNQRVLVVDRGQGPYRILYVSGRPNWEFKFLNRALAEDAQVELVALIRIALREPKFDFRGRIGETSNPLFRGFDRKTETTESYDQPVVVRLNTKDASELAGGFPKTAAELYRYTAVILDDLESAFFTRDQLGLLQKFVSERGGGFLMLGGAESFQQGKYEHTPVEELLPVYLGAAPDPQPNVKLRLSLTREGWLQPWARLRDNEADERRRLVEMAPFQVFNPVHEVKPGASIIAQAQDEAGKTYPALVAQRFGNGRVGALLLGDLWHWGLHDEVAHRDQDKAWRQMIRWLIADVPRRLEFHVENKPDDANQALTLQVRARDKEFKPLDNATVRVSITPTLNNATTNVVRLNAEPAATEAGLYEATFVPRATGGYLAEAVVTDGEGVEVGRAQTGWAADPAAEEFRSLKPNRALLEQLARQTGGEIIAPGALGKFVATLPNRSAPITENVSRPLWHQPSVFLVALLCLVAEWGLRRWKGMA